ncbi:hypothetical protein K1719_028306 [Acacia pycnantha]|nr:hypothetical protein K1719_028306 [Acacia pycnantha]
MLKRITPSHIFVFLLLSPTVSAQSTPAPAASPNAPLHTYHVSFTPVIFTLIFAFFFVGCFAIYLHHRSYMELAARNPTGVTDNCSPSAPQGIDSKLLDTFPTIVYSAVKNLKFGKAAAAPECAVCLGEFDHHDKLRLLPKCNHVFHLQCIDAWLASHVTCPVCRSRLKPAEEHRRGENDIVIAISNEV